jgi:ribulose-phosphate 3-epimerase
VRPFVCSASVMCANLGRLEEAFQQLEAAGCYGLHFEIMDGLFAPHLTVGFDFIKLAKKVCALPCTAHLMISRPERYIDRFVEAGADTVTVHVESCVHAHRALMQIKDAGASPGIAVNPATPLTKLTYLLPLAERVVVMTTDPGHSDQPLIASAFERVKILRENLDYQRRACSIQVAGNINVKNGAVLVNMGADHLVLGTAGISNGGDLSANYRAFCDDIHRERVVL